MPGLTVFSQRPNPNLLRVLGAAFDRGWPEPISIDSVTVSIDGNPAVDATLDGAYRDGRMLVRRFNADFNTSGGSSARVTATNELGFSATRTVVLPPPGPLPPRPVASVLTGTISFATDFALTGQPWSAPIVWGILFDGSLTHSMGRSLRRRSQVSLKSK